MISTSEGSSLPTRAALSTSVSISSSSSPPHSKLLFGLTINARLHWSPRMPSSFVGIAPKVPSSPRRWASRNGAVRFRYIASFHFERKISRLGYILIGVSDGPVHDIRRRRK
ncbi:uncharacterized protein SEPMUDRAFT_148121 [Sphaerulina musiva SO2202]|uniref:Uncharacterized protein n=1 Tax=Sphaerulina musiva (strain SO2202) TaxID=692275 RepID=M3D8G0_SPHMS|nr:uncharacterized protein SEPMUDRAFT_148121 [Sphaerulina musiva SO2202]EMF14405.1 hypothetical protein SEPMUDRAFT_148121 [Sphaerulina musiva SO2202]